MYEEARIYTAEETAQYETRVEALRAALAGLSLAEASDVFNDVIARVQAPIRL